MVTSHWHHFKQCFLVQSIPCKARLTLPVQQGAHSQTQGGVSLRFTALICVGKHCRFLQSKCVIYGVWATKEVYSPIKIILSWFLSRHLTLLLQEWTKKDRLVYHESILSTAQGDISNMKKCDFGGVIYHWNTVADKPQEPFTHTGCMKRLPAPHIRVYFVK